MYALLVHADWVAWLHPVLRKTVEPGSGSAAKKESGTGRRLTSFFKAVSGPENNGRYGKHADDVKAGATAAGVRPGVINFLMTKMPAEFVAAATGHELTGKSALFEYLDPSRALMLPAATVLAKFPAFPHGRILKGPKAPST